MIISILNQTFYYDNLKTSVEQIMTDIESTVKQNNLVVSNLNIDGVDVWDGFPDYISQHIENIQNVTVVVGTLEQFTLEIQESLREYLSRAIPEIDSLSKDFYNNLSPETWNKLGQFTDGVQWIHNCLHFLRDRGMVSVSPIIEQVEQQLNELELAVTGMDAVLIADLLSYEFIPILNQLEALLEHFLVGEGNTNDPDR